MVIVYVMDWNVIINFLTDKKNKMKVANYTAETLTNILIERVNDIEQRERIVLKFPFGNDINRIEIYCSETDTKDTLGNMLGGAKFNGIVTMQVFRDYTNKSTEKSSYSYKKEFLNYLPKLVNIIYSKILINQ
jgi:hypothetical protein